MSLSQILHKSISGNVSRSPDQCGGHGTIKAPNPFAPQNAAQTITCRREWKKLGKDFIMQKCLSNLVIWKFYHCWDWTNHPEKKKKKVNFTSKFVPPKKLEEIGSVVFFTGMDGKVHRLRIGSGPAACVASPPAGCRPDEASRGWFVMTTWKLWDFWAQIAT